MKLFLYFTLILTLLSTCFAATSMGFYSDSNHPGKCTINPYLIMSPGDIVKDPDTVCGRIICGENGLANFHSCSPMGVPADCSIGDFIDTERDYPDCCEREIICA